MITDQITQSTNAMLHDPTDQPPSIPDSRRTIEWSGAHIRIFGLDENLWFHAADTASALGYVKSRNAISMHISSCDKCTGLEFSKQNPSLELNQYEKQAILINKRGVCSLLAASKMPNKSGLIELISTTFGITYDIITRLGKEQEYIGSIITTFAYCQPMRQFKVGSYLIDLYFQVENLAIECDEFNHNQYDQVADAARQEFIMKELGCKFIRFNPDDPSFSIFRVMHDIGIVILQHHRK